MSASPAVDIRAHLEAELTSADPWRLDSNPFEQQRFAAMLGMIAPHAPFASALEVGCAAGAFTERLAPLCRRLHVMDLEPRALALAAARLGNPGHLSWEAADVAGPMDAVARFDLIVAAEVLYYLPDAATLRRAVENLATALAPGGLLIFGSAVDAACARWGLASGAETAIAAFSLHLREIGRVSLQGADEGENCLVTAFQRDLSDAGVPEAPRLRRR